jgi:hypothetical protein
MIATDVYCRTLSAGNQVVYARISRNRSISIIRTSPPSSC